MNFREHYKMFSCEQTISIFLLIISTKLSENVKMSEKKHAWFCKKQSGSPSFNKNVVVGKPWRIFYSWNVDMEDKCMDFVVKNATDIIINRIWYDMHKYLEKQPDWYRASLHTSLGSNKHELLLIDDDTIPGSFVGVPHIVGNDLSRLSTLETSIPLFKFFLKLVRNKYLLMMDCRMGIAALLSRDQPPNRAEVASLAHSLGLGDGGPACVDANEKNVYLIEHNIAE